MELDISSWRDITLHHGSLERDSCKIIRNKPQKISAIKTSQKYLQHTPRLHKQIALHRRGGYDEVRLEHGLAGVDEHLAHSGVDALKCEYIC